MVLSIFYVEKHHSYIGCCAVCDAYSDVFVIDFSSGIEPIAQGIACHLGYSTHVNIARRTVVFLEKHESVKFISGHSEVLPTVVGNTEIHGYKNVKRNYPNITSTRIYMCSKCWNV